RSAHGGDGGADHAWRPAPEWIGGSDDPGYRPPRCGDRRTGGGARRGPGSRKAVSRGAASGRVAGARRAAPMTVLGVTNCTAERGLDTAATTLPGGLFRYVVATSWVHQLPLLALTVAVFLLEVVPLELQRL